MPTLAASFARWAFALRRDVASEARSILMTGAELVSGLGFDVRVHATEESLQAGLCRVAEIVLGLVDIHNVDIATTANGKFLYTINSQSGNIGVFAINQDGSLTNLGQATCQNQLASTASPHSRQPISRVAESYFATRGPLIP